MKCDWASPGGVDITYSGDISDRAELDQNPWQKFFRLGAETVADFRGPATQHSLCSFAKKMETT